MKLVWTLVLWALLAVHARNLHWIGDVITIKSSGVRFIGPWYLDVLAITNGQLHRGDGGHFKLIVNAETAQYGNVTGTSPCIEIGSTGPAINSMLDNTVLTTTTANFTQSYTMNSFISTATKRIFQQNLSYSRTDYAFEFDGPPVLYLHIHMSTIGCSTPRTIGRWNDPYRWLEHAVPSSIDQVNIPSKSGVIVVENDVSISSLTMSSGQLLAATSQCPSGWSSSSYGTSSSKCYKLFQNISNYASARQACDNVGFGSQDAGLVEIQNYDELDDVKRLCRGTNSSSTARLHGCWIGLQHTAVRSGYLWQQPNTVGGGSASVATAFRDWHRNEPNNHTVSEGESTPGELCVQLLPCQEDPLAQEQGSWNDISCQLSKPAVCQIFANTHRHTISVAGVTHVSQGVLQGGIMSLAGFSNLTAIHARNSATINLLPTAVGSVLESVILEDGSNLNIQASGVTLNKDSFIGELEPSLTPLWVYGLMDAYSASMTFNPFAMQSVMRIDSSSASLISRTATCHAGGNTVGACTSAFSVIVNARADVQGTIVVDDHVVFQLNQGGSLSLATLNVTTPTSQLELGGYAARMSSYDAFDLTLSHRGPVLGEYLDNALVEDKRLVGVYRLQVSDTFYGAPRTNITQCIIYNATAQDLADALSGMSIIQAHGGVTVRSYGDGSDPSFGYGYTFRVELDSPSTQLFAHGPLAISLYCYGMAQCGCAETKVPLYDRSGFPICPRKGNSSAVNPGECVMNPNITMTRVSTLSYTTTSGMGSLMITAGVHRLPPLSPLNIGSTGGRGHVGADLISWRGISALGTGTLILAGTGWTAWDSSNVLYMPDWEYFRGFVKELENAPPFNMFADTFNLGGFGSVYTACPRSNMTWGNGNWSGGVIGGRSTLELTGVMNAGGSNKALRYGITLWIQHGAEMIWNGGNVSLADGADIIVEGFLYVNTRELRQFFGQASLMSVPASDLGGAALLASQRGRNFHGYYGRELPAEVRGGWYQNPLCGEQCLDVNQLLVRGSGVVATADHANATFLLPLNLMGVSQLNIGVNSYIELATGGLCGNTVVMDISYGTTLRLSGGSVLMQATCTIKGAGELLITAGEHDLAFSIDAHITLEGGMLVWPLSRGVKKTITFNGGLLIQGSGELQVQPFSTTILIHKEVILKDNCLVQFPMIGIAAQAAPSDRQDAPDPSPRGNFTVTGIMTWAGGTLRGKADFNALHSLYLEGAVKKIRSLAKLVNKGHCEWSTGNLVMADNADFLNLGTLQMANGVAAFNGGGLYEGSILPTENGGDVFALDYHSWDMDEGFLSAAEYVRLRTEFVSRAPNGWTEATQKQQEVLIPI